MRLLNQAGDALRAGGIAWPSLDAEVLVERARRTAGARDLGEEGWQEGLEVLLRSARGEASLTPFGRVAMALHVTNALVSRLRRLAARQRKARALSASLDRPILVVGLPRSGTTLLHRLLSQAPGARALPTWEVRCPLPPAPPRPDLRRALTRAQIRGLKHAAPGIDAKHHVDADEPEECVFLLDSSLRSASFWMMAPVFSYMEWLVDQDMRVAYRAYREHLLLLQAARPGERLVLKAPAHTRFLDVVAEILPEALFVQTHRDPLPVAASVCSLFASFHGSVSRGVDLRRVAGLNVELLAGMAEASLCGAASLPEDRLLHVRYDELAADPLGQVRRVHERFGLPLDDETELALRRYLDERPRDRFGRHAYAASDFGLSETQLALRFRPYVERFLEG